MFNFPPRRRTNPPGKRCTFTDIWLIAIALILITGILDKVAP